MIWDAVRLWLLLSLATLLAALLLRPAPTLAASDFLYAVPAACKSAAVMMDAWGLYAEANASPPGWQARETGRHWVALSDPPRETEAIRAN